MLENVYDFEQIRMRKEMREEERDYVCFYGKCASYIGLACLDWGLKICSVKLFLKILKVILKIICSFF